MGGNPPATTCTLGGTMTTRPGWRGALLCVTLAAALSACDVDSMLGPSEVSIPAKAPRQLMTTTGGLITLSPTSRIYFEVQTFDPILIDPPEFILQLSGCTSGPGVWQVPAYTYSTNLDVGQIDGIYAPVGDLLGYDFPEQLTETYPDIHLPYLGPTPEDQMTVGVFGVYNIWPGIVTAEVRNLVNGQWVRDPASVRTMPFSYRVFHYEINLGYTACRP